MKYVTGANDAHHCTNVLRGRYSKKLSKHAIRGQGPGAGVQGPETLGLGSPIVCDEQPGGSFAALYICGVAARGYRKKENYPHNLHLPIPSEAELPARYRCLPPEYTTCRIFRWAVNWAAGSPTARH